MLGKHQQCSKRGSRLPHEASVVKVQEHIAFVARVEEDRAVVEALA